MQLYLISLHGQGDTDIRLVEKDVWDWVVSPADFKGKSFLNEVPPQSVLDKINLQNKKWGQKQQKNVQITVGSFNNDRALLAPAYKNFYSVREMTLFVGEQNIKIVDEFEGCIY